MIPLLFFFLEQLGRESSMIIEIFALQDQFALPVP